MDSAESCEIISVQNSRIVFSQDKLVDILRECDETTRIVIVSIVGKPQAGKSFLINLIAKYLRHNGDRNWIGAKDDKLVGFVWHPNPEDDEKDGTGIHVLRHAPIIYGHNEKNEIDSSKKATVLLLDIDLKRGNDFSKHLAALTATCMSISSLAIFVETDIGIVSQSDTKLIARLLQEIVQIDLETRTRDIIVAWNPTVLKSSAEKISNCHPMLDLPKNRFTVSTHLFTDLRKSPKIGYFQGEPEYLHTDKLKRLMGSMISIEGLLAGTKKWKQGVPNVLSLIQQVVESMNELLETTKWKAVTSMAMEDPAIDHSSVTLMANDSITESTEEQCQRKVHEAQVTLNKPKCDKEPLSNSTISAITREKLLPSEIADYVPPEDKEKHKETSSFLLPTKPSKAKFSAGLIGTTTSQQPVPTHSPTLLQSQVTPQQCFEEFRKLLSKNLKFFVLPTIRIQFIQILQLHVLDKYYQNRPPADKNCVYKLLKQLTSSLSPIVEALDKSNMIIENEFDSCVCLIDSEIPQLLSRAKAFSKSRFISKGDKQLEASFETCWKSIAEVVQTRNYNIQKLEMQKQHRALELVQQFYETELAKLITQTEKPDALDKSNKELEADSIQILLGLCDFKQNAAAVAKNELKNKMSAAYKSRTAHLQPVHVPQVSKSDPLKTTFQSPMPVSNAAAVTQKQPPNQYQSTSELKIQLQLVPPEPILTTFQDHGTIIVIHFNRSSDMKYAVIQNSGSARSKIKIIPTFLAYIDDEIVIGEQAAMQRGQHVINIKTVRPGTLTRLNINGSEEELQYEEVIGLWLGKLRQRVEQQLKELIKTCVIVIPIMTSNVGRQAIRDSASCAGFHKITLINEPTAAATLCSSNYNQGTRTVTEQEKYVLVVYFAKPDQTEFVIYSKSTTSPLLQTKSVSGSSYLSTFSNSLFDNFKFWENKHNHERYFHDVKQHLGIKSENISKLIMVGDSSTNKPRLEVDALRKYFISSEGINYEECVVQGAIRIAEQLRNCIQMDTIIEECLPYPIVLRSSAGQNPIFERHRSLPATSNKTIDISSEDRSLTFDLLYFISTANSRILGNYCVTIDEPSASTWDAVNCQFDLDSFGILQVTGQLIHKKSNGSKSRQVIVVRTDPMNLQQSALNKCSQNIKTWLNFTLDKQFKLKFKDQLRDYKDQLIESFMQIRSQQNQATIELFDKAIGFTDTMLSEHSSGKEMLQKQMSYLQKMAKSIFIKNESI